MQHTDSDDMDALLRAYERLAPLYDFFFGKTLDRGRRVAVRAFLLFDTNASIATGKYAVLLCGEVY